MLIETGKKYAASLLLIRWRAMDKSKIWTYGMSREAGAGQFRTFALRKKIVRKQRGTPRSCPGRILLPPGRRSTPARKWMARPSAAAGIISGRRAPVRADAGPSPRSRTMKLTIAGFLLGVVTIAAVAAPAAAYADAVTVRIDSPMPPPRWAQLQRKLLDDNHSA